MRMRIATLLICSVLALSLGGQTVPGPEMVRFAGGAFTIGTEPAQIDALMARFHTQRRSIFLAEVPAHSTTIAPFAIDTTEVTNAAFKVFLDRRPEWSRDRMPADRHNGDYLKTWSAGQYPTDEGNLPVTFITWTAAAAYCESQSKRLPTEAEWEFAASGGTVIEFPWGDDLPDKTRANWSVAGLGKPAPAASFPPTASGLYDMAGNVWEFVQDRWTDNYATPVTTTDRRVIRGGSFDAAPVNLRVRYRDSHPETGAGPHVGFRCAR